jgi:hypothetical protein
MRPVSHRLRWIGPSSAERKHTHEAFLRALGAIELLIGAPSTHKSIEPGRKTEAIGDADISLATAMGLCVGSRIAGEKTLAGLAVRIVTGHCCEGSTTAT